MDNDLELFKVKRKRKREKIKFLNFISVKASERNIEFFVINREFIIF